MAVRTSVAAADLAAWFRAMAAEARTLQAHARTVGMREYHHGTADALDRAADKVDETLLAVGG
jgi:hypothetical protein